MTTPVGNPFPMFFDRRGRPLDGGSIYIGEPGLDPEDNPIVIYSDPDLTNDVAQPIRTIGGRMVERGSSILLFADVETYSIRVRDADGAEVFYSTSGNPTAQSFQPLDSDLSAIAALSTTSFGRALLAQASAADLRSYIGVPAALPLTGGTITGPILRQNAGAHLFFDSASLTSGRVYITENGAGDPRADPSKDIWFERVAS